MYASGMVFGDRIEMHEVPYMSPEEWRDIAPHGWRDIVFDLVSDIHAIAMRDGVKGVWVTDIKEKWGRLDVSLSGYTDAIDERIEEAEDLADKTCVRCGGKAGPRARCNGWVTNFCQPCIQVEKMRRSISDHILKS